MNTIYLLTAEPRTGKTTCIQKIIEQIGSEKCEGFYTKEVRENGERTGFVCVSLKGEQVTLADIYSNSALRVSRYGVEVEEFEKLAIPTIENALTTNKILVIDEIGPMELLSEPFKEVLEKALNSGKIILGTIFFNSHPEVDKFKEHPNIQLIALTEENRNEVPFQIADKLKGLFN